MFWRETRAAGAAEIGDDMVSSNVARASQRIVENMMATVLLVVLLMVCLCCSERETNGGSV